MTVPFMYNFEALICNKFPSDCLSLIKSFYFSLGKRKPKLFALKNVMERGIKKKFHFRNALICI